MERYWINAPSLLDPCHIFNGVAVLCDKSVRIGSCVTVYFTRGSVVSAVIPAKFLAKGWRKEHVEC